VLIKCVLLTMLILFALWVYSSFFGDPVSKYITRKKVQNYLEEYYPNNNFKIKSIDYDFKFGGYSVKIISEKDTAVKYVISARTNGVVYDQYKEEHLRDREMEARFSDHIEEVLLSLIKSKVPELAAIQIEIVIRKGKYDKNADYSMDMDEVIKVYVNIHEKGSDKLSMGDFLEKAIQIRDIVTDRGFKMEYFHCYYYFRQKGDGFGLELRRDQLHQSGDSLIDRVIDYSVLNQKRS